MTNAREPRVLALANQKGGVGKTTTAINLGTALAAIGEDVLIVDLDPQGNASTGLGIGHKQRIHSTYEVLVGDCDLEATIVETVVPRLRIAPSTLDLLGVELEIAHDRDRAFKLKKAIQALAAVEGFECSYVLVDCPPSLNLLTINAMTAADAVLVPLQCEFFALEGLSQLLKTVEQVKDTLNPRLSIHGIVLTMYDARNNLSGQVVADVRQFMGEKVYQTVIPRNVRVSEAPSYGKPALLYDLKCPAARPMFVSHPKSFSAKKRYGPRSRQVRCGAADRDDGGRTQPAAPRPRPRGADRRCRGGSCGDRARPRPEARSRDIPARPIPKQSAHALRRGGSRGSRRLDPRKGRHPGDPGAHRPGRLRCL